MSEDDRKVRIDKWLWAARFFRTRALAIEAIKLGRIQCNRSRPKPSRSLRLGDRLIIEKGDLVFDVEVMALSEQRGPAKVAQSLFQETEDSLKAREAASLMRRAQRLSAPQAPQTRPDKHDRQSIRRFLGR
ncbi:MAG: RNA-binding S4 domain-containing protein [Oceanococcus sp.]